MPIDELKADIEASVFRIAPERRRELAEFFKHRRPKFIWTDEARTLPRVNPRDAKISLPLLGLMLIWAEALQCWVFYDEHTNDQSKGINVFNLFGSPRRVEAITAFEWALQNFKQSQVSVPKPTLVPSANPRYGSDEHVANELFLAAIAWILHHEIAHLRLNHTSVTAMSRQEETCADAEALLWILELEQDESRRKKRILGACVALLVITALDLDRGSFMDTTHPRVFDRMFNMLEQSSLADDHVAFAFCTTMIRVELSKLELPMPSDTGANWRDICYDHLAALHRLGASSKGEV